MKLNENTHENVKNKTIDNNKYYIIFRKNSIRSARDYTKTTSRGILYLNYIIILCIIHVYNYYGATSLQV